MTDSMRAVEDINGFKIILCNVCTQRFIKKKYTKILLKNTQRFFKKKFSVYDGCLTL